MPARVPVTRRQFIDTLAAAPVTAALNRGVKRPNGDVQGAAVANGAPPDVPRSLRPAEADLGANFEAVHALDPGAAYPGSFLSGRFASLGAFTTQGRASILEAYGHRPPVVAPAAEVLDRFEGPDFIREKVLFSTTPHFRVPAYVHIPKRLSGPAPAIVDLHSHGGMFIFGKEKVIDFGRNHPAMTTYHAGNYEGRPTATALVRRGYVVITIDAFMFGERRVLMDADLASGWDRSNYSVEDVARLNRVCAAKESTLAKTLTVLGMTWPGIVAWDDMRTVDYLLTGRRWIPHAWAASASRWAGSGRCSSPRSTLASARGASSASCPRFGRCCSDTSTRTRGSTSCPDCTGTSTCRTS